MDKRSTVIVSLIAFSFVIIMALTAYLTTGVSPIKSTATKKRFSAPPGKSPEQSLVLVSKKRENTFSDDFMTSSDESQVKDIQVSQIGKGNTASPNLIQDPKDKPQKEISHQTELEVSEELKKLLQSSSPNSQTEKLNQVMDSIKNPKDALKILNNNLETLLSKGLNEWVETKLNEIISSSTDDIATLSEANLMLAQVEVAKGNNATAEELLKKSWESLTKSNFKENEELIRLVGLNYARFLLNNKNEEVYKQVIQYIQNNFPKSSN